MMLVKYIELAQDEPAPKRGQPIDLNRLVDVIPENGNRVYSVVKFVFVNDACNGVYITCWEIGKRQR